MGYKFRPSTFDIHCLIFGKGIEMFIKSILVAFLALTFLEIDAMPGREEIMNEKHIGVEDRSCIALGSNGCEGNDAKCCRDGNPYTGTMRKCRNTGSFSSPVFTCQD